MTSIDSGFYGAKVASWDTASARAFFKKIADQNTGMDKEFLFKRVLAEALDPDNADILQTIVKYWFVNAHNWWDADRQAPKTSQQKAKVKAAKAKKVAKAKKAIKAKAQQIVLMDLVMANGKALRDCTGRECSKFGGWLNKVAGKVGANGIVGKKLSEADLKQIFKSA